MADLGLRVRPIEASGFLSVESDSMILEDAVSDAVLKAAEKLGMQAAPTLVYLINEINAANRTDLKHSLFDVFDCRRTGLSAERAAGPVSAE